MTRHHENPKFLFTIRKTLFISPTGIFHDFSGGKVDWAQHSLNRQSQAEEVTSEPIAHYLWSLPLWKQGAMANKLTVGKSQVEAWLSKLPNFDKEDPKPGHYQVSCHLQRAIVFKLRPSALS